MTARKIMTARKPRNQPRHDEEQLGLTAAGSRITVLTPLAPKGEGVHVYFDGVPWRIIPRHVVKELNLRVDQIHHPESLDERVTEVERRQAMEMAWRMFSYRPRSCDEVRDRLLRKRFSKQAAEWVIEQLESSGHLNDRIFVRTWIKDRMELKKYGRHRIRGELLSKGIDAEAINVELDSIYPADEEVRTASELVEARLQRYLGLDETVMRRRLGQFLLRRGYSAATAQTVIRELMATLTR